MSPRPQETENLLKQRMLRNPRTDSHTEENGIESPSSKSLIP